MSGCPVGNEIPLTLQTVYAELLDQVAAAAFADDFNEDGNFVAKTIKGKKYWYFEQKSEEGWKQKYVGPETPELLEKIVTHKKQKSEISHRITLVSTLIRSTSLPRVQLQVGQVIAALAKAGVFRLRGVLVGTIAYQTYAAMLGTRLPISAVQTGDVDIAQAADISIAVKDRTPPMLNVLKETDQTFREVPHTYDSRKTTSYVSSSIRVDFLTPNEGKDTDEPRSLPALGTDAQPLRYLNFLIRNPEPAVVLHEAGIFVLVPAPQRYAIHKLIVARLRQAGSAKSKKDIQQAEVLLGLLVVKHPHDLAEAWKEASGRGKKWRALLGEGLGLLHIAVRDSVLKTVQATRSVVPDMDVEFAHASARYDFDRDVVSFVGQSNGALIRCAVSREALDDHFGTDNVGKEGRLEAFRRNRRLFEEMARIKYLKWPVEEPGHVLIRTDEVPELLKQMPKTLKASLEKM
jgi:hypothetical protein